MKQKNYQKQLGFTIIELMVVIGIMSLMSAVVIIDFNRQKVSRNVVLAKNETVTNLRKVQGYMLSSKNIRGDIPAKYYIVEIHKNDSFYTINAVDSQFNYYPAIETVNLPTGVKFTSLTTQSTINTSGGGDVELLLDSGSESGQTSDLESGNGDAAGNNGNLADPNSNTNSDPPGGGSTVYVNEGDCNPIIDKLCHQNGYDGSGIVQADRSVSYDCVQIIFSAPFATMYARAASTCDFSIVGILRNPVLLSQISQGTKYLNFEGTPGAVGAKYIRLSPITGQIVAY